MEADNSEYEEYAKKKYMCIKVAEKKTLMLKCGRKYMKDEIWNKSQLESDGSKTGLEPIEHKLILYSQHAENKEKPECPRAKVTQCCIQKKHTQMQMQL